HRAGVGGVARARRRCARRLDRDRRRRVVHGAPAPDPRPGLRPRSVPPVRARRRPPGEVNMHAIFDPLLVVVLLLNLFVLGTSRRRAGTGASALRGAVLGVLTVSAHGELTAEVLLVACAAVAIKGVLIPRLLHKAMRDVAIEREVEPLIGFIPSLL